MDKKKGQYILLPEKKSENQIQQTILLCPYISTKCEETTNEDLLDMTEEAQVSLNSVSSGAPMVRVGHDK